MNIKKIGSKIDSFGVKIRSELQVKCVLQGSVKEKDLKLLEF